MPLPNHVGVVLLSGFQELEFWYPVLRFREEGVRVTVIGDRPDQTTFSELGYPVIPQVAFGDLPADCDLLIVPGTHKPLPAALADRVAKLVGTASQRGAALAATGTSVAPVTQNKSTQGKLTTASGPDELPAFLHALTGGSSKRLNAQIAMLCEHQYQELELWYPVMRLREAGCNVLIVGPSDTQIYGSKLGYPVIADLSIDEVNADDFDGVIIPGGFAPENLRRNAGILNLVRGANEQGSLVAAICHAGWVLASADIARGRRLTCVSIIKDDVKHAGGNYVDEPVVRDGNLITSRLPGDLQDFGRAIVDYLATEPSKRRGDRRLAPSRGRGYATAAYGAAANVVMTARGQASANYMLTVLDSAGK
jgi:protease I